MARMTAYGKDRDSLFTLMTERGVPPTNNSSERDLRPSTTFRKVTGGFRFDWAPDFYAAFRSTFNTGRKQGLTALRPIELTLSGQSIFQAG